MAFVVPSTLPAVCRLVRAVLPTNNLAKMPQPPRSFTDYSWSSLQDIQSTKYSCAFCGHLVAAIKGYQLSYKHGGSRSGITICPECRCPTFHYTDSQATLPSVAFGKPVRHMPAEIEQLYEEARTCTSNNCFTGAVLLLRKLLMNIAVTQGAAEGLSFAKYVDHLGVQGFIPPNGKQWVDHIRKKGNEATHEIVKMSDKDARDLVVFMEMLLRFIYEFPNELPPTP